VVALSVDGPARLLGALSRRGARQPAVDHPDRHGLGDAARLPRLTTGAGDVDIAGWCGFSLQARAEGGDVRAGTTCSPQRLSLRSTTGAVHAQVPPGRYRIDASTAGGPPVVRGITSDPDAPYAIQALSSSGHVMVERAP
jgi:hypothetical protein